MNIRVLRLAAVVAVLTAALGSNGRATPFFFSTGNVDGLMAMASRPGLGGKLEIEAADDFVLAAGTTLTSGTFTGLLTAPLSSVGAVGVEIYRVFPLDSTNPPSGHVPTRANSPSDVAFDSRSSTASTLSFSASTINPSFTASNSVLNGINPMPNQTTGGEGPVTGSEVVFNFSLTSSLALPAGHYFFVPQVQVTGGEFYWLSSVRPIVAPGTSFAPDLQAWIRNGNLDPDWLRVGTDIVGGTTPPTFNAAFSLTGTVDAAASTPDSGTTLLLLGLSLSSLVALRSSQRGRPEGR